jgi:hypothetical protein
VVPWNRLSKPFHPLSLVSIGVYGDGRAFYIGVKNMRRLLTNVAGSCLNRNKNGDRIGYRCRSVIKSLGERKC